MSAGFCHLHVHTEYSVLDGASKIGDLLERCKTFGMEACALTDHGCLFGALDFYQSAKKAGIKPIIGCELYVARKDRFDKSAKSASESCYHLVLLCENETGYHNLCRLSSLGYIEGFHYRPRVDMELLAKYSEGLIASSACLAGRIPQALMANDTDGAEQAIREYTEIFGEDRFYIELMDHDLPEERRINPTLVELAAKHGLKIIATNDSHYTDQSDSEAHEALLCIQTNNMLDDEKRFRFPGGPAYYFASPDEMAEKFQQWPEALTNTLEIAERCNVDLPMGQHLIPQFVPPEGQDKAGYLRALVHEGIVKRYGENPSQEYTDRGDFELDVIEQMGFVDYFLVVWDLIHWAREHGIPVGPGRGSGAGSLVAYALEITNIDPIRYGLLFERFLNPERVSMPDFDLDFCYNRRGEMIEYVREEYGSDNVSQIITFGRMLAKQAVRNVGRVLGMSYGDVDRIAKLVPDELKITLKASHEREPELQQLVKTDPQIGRLWNLASRLEGTIGNCGTHAAGVVICDQPLTDHVPLFKAAGSDTVATQFEMKNVEAVGLLKMDFLGLRTLTVVHEAVRFVKENRGIDIDVDALEPDDAAAYALLRSGQTTGIFQLESSGMRELAKRIGLESLEEICGLVALYRPGPMQLKDQYIECKHQPDKILYDHPLLESILKETYGVALYQEQVMQIVQAVAGFTLGQADILRRAMGKKKADLMAEQRDKFVAGAKANKINEDTASLLFERIEQFAGYGFNKSHSMAYAFVAYQTAYLKANYPVEFMTALLTSEAGNMDKVAQYVEECRRMGVEVLPPDVNTSCHAFTVDGDRIRFGLGAVKNVGEAPVEAVVAQRNADGPFTDIYDFCSRIDTRVINRRVLESLNRAGAFTSTDWNRRQVEEVLDTALGEGQVSQKEREAGQTSLLDLMGGDAAESMRQVPDVPEWDEQILLTYEREVLGLYVSSHPLARHTQTLERFSTVRIADIATMRENDPVVLGGLIANVKHYTTQRGKKMAFVTLDTLEGPVEVTVFSETYEQRADLLVQDEIVVIAAKVKIRNDEAGLLADDIVPIEEAEAKFTKIVHVQLRADLSERGVLDTMAEVLGARPGPCDVYLHCTTPGADEVTVHASSACTVAATPELRSEIERLLGEGSVWYSAGNGLPQHSN
ncbi:MAG: DNA polymerase III subunit alpha [bacterium]|nr:DNA polymerase III subunit alpha [bacterium]